MEEPVARQLDRSPGDGPETAEEVRLAGIGGFMRRVAGYLRPHWKGALLVLVTLVPEVAMETVQPLLVAVLIDDAIIPGDAELVAVIVVALLGLLLLYALSQVTHFYVAVAVGGSVANDIRMSLFRRLQDLPVSFYERQNSGQVLARFTSDMDAIENALVVELPYAFSCVATIVVGSIFMLLLDWRFAALLLLLLPVVTLGPRLLGRHVNRASYRRQADVGRMLGTVEEVTAAQPVVKAFGLRQPMIDRFEEDLGQLLRSTKRAGWLSGLQAGAMTATSHILLTAALGIGAIMGVRGEISIGELVGMFELLWFVMASVTALGGVLPPLQRAAAGMNRVEELKDQHAGLQDAPDAITLPPVQDAIVFDGVSFSYPGTTQGQLEEVSMRIPARRWVSVVGRSGSGKSTLLRLLMRFHDPTEGRVTIDGHDLRAVTQASLRAQMGVVFQEPFLFNASVAANIGLGRPGVGDESIIRAARAADVDDFVSSLPGGYESPVGDRGRELSGGQKQRISLARALVRDPRILILDEPASALDAQSEAAINATLRAVARERTIISVTHRLASAAQADMIFVLDGGRLAEQGTHDELMASRGVYWGLWQRQEREP